MPISLSSYYPPFGSTLPNRSWSDASRAYRYGFNGKEKDSEGMGGGNSTYDYGFRIYNPSLGKFLSVDPLTEIYPWYTPYQFAGNIPISAVDIDGLEEFIVVCKPDATYPKLMVYTITRIDPNSRKDAVVNGVTTKNYVKYITYDEKGAITGTELTSDFKETEKEIMNKEIEVYDESDVNKTSKKVKKREAMDYHSLKEDGTIDETKKRSAGYRLLNGNLLSSQKLFKIKINILFNTDKTTFDKDGLVDLKKANEEISEVVKIINNYDGGTGKASHKGFLKKYNIKIKGGFDIRKSDYKNCGNPCLSKDRALSVEKELNKNGITNTSSEGATKNDSTTVKDSDRNAEIVLVQP